MLTNVYLFDEAKALFVDENGAEVKFHPSYLRSFIPGALRVGHRMGFTRDGDEAWEYEITEISTVQSHFGVSILYHLQKRVLHAKEVTLTSQQLKTLAMKEISSLRTLLSSVSLSDTPACLNEAERVLSQVHASANRLENVISGYKGGKKND